MGGTLAGILRFVVVQVIIFGIAFGVSQAASGNSGSIADAIFDCFRLSLGINIVSFIFASGKMTSSAPTERYYDITGAITYTSVLYYSLASKRLLDLSLRQKVLSCMVILWCSRLGWFLFTRIQKEGGIDSRFVDIKKSFLRFGTAFTLQALWVFLTALPVYAINVSADSMPITWADYCGWTLWIVGFVVEVIADTQKSAFRDESHNHGKFITTGLWSWSRHPNYAGEISLWIGVFISAVNALQTGFTLAPQLLAYACSPVFVFLLINYVSGVNLLESASDKKWGSRKDYQEYKARTPVVFPIIGRRG
jgi:steroid 5-alpha reductase family enzyme